MEMTIFIKSCINTDTATITPFIPSNKTDKTSYQQASDRHEAVLGY